MDSCFVEVLGLRLEYQDEGSLLRPEKEAVLDVGQRSWGPFLQGRGLRAPRDRVSSPVQMGQSVLVLIHIQQRSSFFSLPQSGLQRRLVSP